MEIEEFIEGKIYEIDEVMKNVKKELLDKDFKRRNIEYEDLARFYLELNEKLGEWVSAYVFLVKGDKPEIARKYTAVLQGLENEDRV